MSIDITSAIIVKALVPGIPNPCPTGYSQEKFEKAASRLREAIANADQPFSPLAHVHIADSAKGADE